MKYLVLAVLIVSGAFACAAIFEPPVTYIAAAIVGLVGGAVWSNHFA